MSNVLFLFGINGVGKSTLSRALAARWPGTITVGSSEVLRAAFGGVSRKTLEQASPEAKHQVLRAALEQTFERHREAPLVICDAHLTVAISGTDGLRYERMWDPSLAEYAAAYVCVTAPVQQVIARRRSDLARGRFRSLCPLLAAAHAATEVDEHRARFGDSRLAHVIANDGPVTAAAEQIQALLPHL